MKTLSRAFVALAAVALLAASCKKTTTQPYVPTGGYWVYHSDTVYVKSSVLTTDYNSLDEILTCTDSTADHVMLFDFDTSPPNGRCAIGTYGDRTVSITMTMNGQQYKAVYTTADDDTYVQWPKNRGTFTIQSWTVKFVNNSDPADSLRVPFRISQLR
ncbi:MAG: hypothetical protein JST90_19585 [Bacteroidetes bacterium]|nr:hypothetical protein [Bacteroidota bacterium]